LFTHDLARIPTFTCDFAVQQVTDEAAAERLKQAAGSRQVRGQDLTANPVVLRQYMAIDGEEPVGWVRSIACGNAGWCSNMYVKAPYRRHGIGKALMARMLQDDRLCGLKGAVLAASHVGAMLYPVVGYEQIGQLMIFTPIRK
jgi:GNAT superfamily N-acetyltransferase